MKHVAGIVGGVVLVGRVRRSRGGPVRVRRSEMGNSGELGIEVITGGSLRVKGVTKCRWRRIMAS